MAQQNDDYLYHYTTVDALLGIVKKQELWLNNIFYLNDTAEFHLAVTLARELLRAEMNRPDADGKRSLEKACNLLDEVPQIEGFFSLTPREVSQVTALLPIRVRRLARLEANA